MSALPPKADMCGATRDVCFGPKADMMSLENLTGPRSNAKRKSNTVIAGRTAGPAVARAETDPSQLYILYAQVAKLNPVPVPAGVR
jgi:hypothetical protein